MSELTIVMYHYVRDLERSRYPKIKARRTFEFERQLDHLERHHSIVTAQDVISAVSGEKPLPDKAAWLTFDDGYLDHYTTVFPLLYRRGWQGSFFSPARTVLEGRLLDVNKIHLILASVNDVRGVIERIKEHVDANLEKLPLSFTEFLETHAIATRFDPAEVVFIKKMLQHVLPPYLRASVIDDLFCKFVSADERAIAAELYMSLEQMKLMLSCGMFFGSHSYDHLWMNRLTPKEQEREVDLSMNFLAELGVPMRDWVMCYPYGAYDASLIEILKRRKCAIGLTTQVAVADISRDMPLQLPRLDTNDLPICRSADLTNKAEKL